MPDREMKVVVRSKDDLTAVSKAFDELRRELEALPHMAVSLDGDSMEKLRERNRRYLDEKLSFVAAERSIDESRLRVTDELERRSWELRLKYAEAGSAAVSNIMQNLYVATGSKHRAMFEAMKAFAVAETIIQTYRAAQGAYAALAPIPVVGPALGAAAATAAVAAGLARVEQIRNTRPGGATSSISAGGRANPDYSGGSPSAYPVPTRSEDPTVQHITIQINNPLSEQNWQRIVEDNIIPAIKDAGSRNISVTYNG